VRTSPPSGTGTVDGAPLISLRAENRARAGVATGDEVDVEVVLDAAPREVDVPADRAAAPAATPEAERTWSGRPTAAVRPVTTLARARRRMVQCPIG
jgi:hypothetical protein